LSHAAHRMAQGNVGRITVFTHDGGIVVRNRMSPDRYRSLEELRDELAPTLTIEVVGYKPAIARRVRRPGIRRTQIRNLRCPSRQRIFVPELPQRSSVRPMERARASVATITRYQRIWWIVRLSRSGKWFLPTRLADGTLGSEAWKAQPHIKRSMPLPIPSQSVVVPAPTSSDQLVALPIAA
jgi:hypothetical protein